MDKKLANALKTSGRRLLIAAVLFAATILGGYFFEAKLISGAANEGLLWTMAFVPAIFMVLVGCIDFVLKKNQLKKIAGVDDLLGEVFVFTFLHGLLWAECMKSICKTKSISLGDEKMFVCICVPLIILCFIAALLLIQDLKAIDREA